MAEEKEYLRDYELTSEDEAEEQLYRRRYDWYKDLPYICDISEIFKDKGFKEPCCVDRGLFREEVYYNVYVRSNLDWRHDVKIAEEISKKHDLELGKRILGFPKVLFSDSVTNRNPNNPFVEFKDVVVYELCSYLETFNKGEQFQEAGIKDRDKYSVTELLDKVDIEKAYALCTFFKYDEFTSIRIDQDSSFAFLGVYKINEGESKKRGVLVWDRVSDSLSLSWGIGKK